MSEERTSEEIIEAAEAYCAEIAEGSGRVELDPDHEINRVTHPRGNGAWVKAWVFIPDE